MNGTMVLGVFWLGMLAFAAIGTMWIFRLPPSGGRFARKRTPHDILDTRFASGEIDREEYLAKRRELGA
jgi:uncharacterized membrane protein